MSGGPPGVPWGADFEAKVCFKREISGVEFGTKMLPKRLLKIDSKITLREKLRNSETSHFGVHVEVPFWSHLGRQVGVILDGKLGSF